MSVKNPYIVRGRGGRISCKRFQKTPTLRRPAKKPATLKA